MNTYIDFRWKNGLGIMRDLKYIVKGRNVNLMENMTLKITVEHGKENDFIVHCQTNGIMYKQYPKPITWAFRVEIYKSLINEMLGNLNYIKIEPMPIVGFN